MFVFSQALSGTLGYCLSAALLLSTVTLGISVAGIFVAIGTIMALGTFLASSLGFLAFVLLISAFAVGAMSFATLGAYAATTSSLAAMRHLSKLLFGSLSAPKITMGPSHTSAHPIIITHEETIEPSLAIAEASSINTDPDRDQVENILPGIDSRIDIVAEKESSKELQEVLQKQEKQIETPLGAVEEEQRKPSPSSTYVSPVAVLPLIRTSPTKKTTSGVVPTKKQPNNGTPAEVTLGPVTTNTNNTLPKVEVTSPQVPKVGIPPHVAVQPKSKSPRVIAVKIVKQGQSTPQTGDSASNRKVMNKVQGIEEMTKAEGGNTTSTNTTNSVLPKNKKSATGSSSMTPSIAAPLPQLSFPHPVAAAAPLTKDKSSTSSPKVPNTSTPSPPASRSAIVNDGRKANSTQSASHSNIENSSNSPLESARSLGTDSMSDISGTVSSVGQGDVPKAKKKKNKKKNKKKGGAAVAPTATAK